MPAFGLALLPNLFPIRSVALSLSAWDVIAIAEGMLLTVNGCARAGAHKNGLMTVAKFEEAHSPPRSACSRWIAGSRAL